MYVNNSLQGIALYVVHTPYIYMYYIYYVFSTISTPIFKSILFTMPHPHSLAWGKNAQRASQKLEPWLSDSSIVKQDQNAWAEIKQPIGIPYRMFRNCSRFRLLLHCCIERITAATSSSLITSQLQQPLKKQNETFNGAFWHPNKGTFSHPYVCMHWLIYQ